MRQLEEEKKKKEKKKKKKRRARGNNNVNKYCLPGYPSTTQTGRAGTLLGPITCNEKSNHIIPCI